MKCFIESGIRKRRRRLRRKMQSNEIVCEKVHGKVVVITQNGLVGKLKCCPLCIVEKVNQMVKEINGEYSNCPTAIDKPKLAS
jgi:hypothetical protein